MRTWIRGNLDWSRRTKRYQTATEPQVLPAGVHRADPHRSGPVTVILAPGTADAWALLSRYRQLTGPASKAPSNGWPNRYARSPATTSAWCDADGTPAQDGWGKGVPRSPRPRRSPGRRRPADQALSGAAAVELVHNFFLLHDDLMDRDRTRRGPHGMDRFGEAQAVLAGDALLALALDVLASAPPRPTEPPRPGTLPGAPRPGRGQGSDMAFESRE
ncbi:hypothetical protein FE156_30060 [Streptomyces albidoflavus]|nr:hypothetical protein FE156_30060 [Streptomyces albidoflavus]